MSEILDIEALRQEADDQQPHQVGAATCTRCKATWIAVAPVGVVELDCTDCGGAFGLFDGPAQPSVVWQCGCGGELFFVTPEGYLCRQCGLQQEFP